MLHHPFCVEMRHYFYTNGDKVSKQTTNLSVARRSIPECGHGLHTWDYLQDHEVLFENEVNGPTSLSKVVLLLTNEINCLHSRSWYLPQRYQAPECVSRSPVPCFETLWLWFCEIVNSRRTKCVLYLFKILQSTRTNLWKFRLLLRHWCVVSGMRHSWTYAWSAYLPRREWCRLTRRNY